MSEVEPQIAAPTLDEAADPDVALEFAEGSADTLCSVVSPQGDHEAGDEDEAEQPADAISNADSVAGDNTGPEIADGTLSLVVEQAEGTPGITDAPVEPEDKVEQASTKPKLSMSVKPTPGKLNGGPPTPLVKKIINSGTFGAGTVGRPQATKPAVTTKPSAAPALKKSTSSSAAVPSKMASSRTPSTSAVPPSRRQSIVPAKPTAPPISKPSLSASANAKPTTPANTRPMATTGTKPAAFTGNTRPSVVSPAGSATSASSRPRASVSEGVKRAPLTSRQSISAGTKPPLATAAKPPVSRSSTAATATARPTRTTPSISSIREVKEDGKALEDLQSRLKEANDSLTSRTGTVAQLETRVGELAKSLETTSADLASKTTLTEKLEQDKSSLETQLSEAKEALLKLESGRENGESILVAVQQDLEATRAASAAQKELVDGLRAQIETLETQARSSKETLENIQTSSASEAKRLADEHEALLKAQADLKAIAAETEDLKISHAAALQESAAKLKDVEANAALVENLAAQIAALKEEKEENSGKLSELEIEILELKESQEATEDERERLLALVKTLEEEVLKATATTQQAHEDARAKEAEVAAQVEELQITQAAALQAASEEQNNLKISLHTLKAELAAALAANEQAKVDALASMEEHARKLEEAGRAHTDKQGELSEHIKRITVELESQETYYNSKVDAVKEEHSRLLQEAFDRAKIEAGEEHAQELQSLRAGSSSSIEQIQAANQLALEELKSEHASLLNSEVNHLEKFIANLKLDLKATQDDLAKAKTALESSRADVIILTQQRDDARALAATIPDSSAQAEEVARLSKELSNTKDDLTAVTEMLNLTKVSLTEMSNNQSKDLEDAAMARAEEVTKLRVAHDEETAVLAAQKSELSVKVSDLEGELLTLKATMESEHASPKTNGNGAAPPISPGVTKEELQRMHEAHNLKIYDLEAEHEKVVKALQEELEASQHKAAELNAEVQRKAMEIQYLEQDQEENQEQITRQAGLFYTRKAYIPTKFIQVTTLGQPLEVLKTQMAANRSQTMWQACRTVWSRGGIVGCYQGLIPWAWIEASTKGAVLVFTASEVETATLAAGINPAFAGLLGGMTGGIAQAYATMGFTTCMKTAEITRHKTAATGVKPPSTWAVFADIYRREGLAGVNKGVNAVAVRQCTNWGSRMGFARLAETSIRKIKGKSETESLGAFDKILASTIGGALATWNQPIEVIRVEMQSMAKGAATNVNRPAKLTIMNTLSYIYKENGIKGLYRGVTPRIGLGIWQTICMVSLADYVKIWVKGRQ
ncbi:hypothetical protein D9615_001404 [Tricholomella constricta]|uniref:Uncharacterized protein n=1 Tax=Tricholomella constricta TaxID=117010 RepID=A0A8H5HKF4_9AGAR|nr:hypothetical protein D9615_001404 [Tricholomella constricta]